MGFWKNFKEKLNPVQHRIADESGGAESTTQTKLTTVCNAYNLVEVVNRSVNMLVDSAAQVEFDVKEELSFTSRIRGMRQKQLDRLLNLAPNPFMDISTFKRLLYMDFIIDGNAFIHFDGTSFYHLPAKNMEIVPDKKEYINHYIYDGDTPLQVNEVIHIKDNSVKSVFRGDSRINSAIKTLLTRESMANFQEKFFDSGAVVGLVVETEAVLSKKFKERQEKEWVAKYNPTGGSKKPLILDAGMKVKSTSQNTFKDMSFNDSVVELEKKVATSLGIPHILLDSGNNANLRPNLELLFSMTIMPMVGKFTHAFEHAFGFDIEGTTHPISALKPDQKAESDRLTALVNNGIMLGSEARAILRLEKIEDPKLDEIRIPANVAGSATGVSGQEGGKPASGED